MTKEYLRTRLLTNCGPKIGQTGKGRTSKRNTEGVVGGRKTSRS